MIASALGSYPRIGNGAEKQRLRRSIQKFQAGELSRDELRRVEDDVVREVLDEQAGAGLDWITDGLVRWEDGQTYFADRLEGFRRGQLIRYFDTNTYYRQPVAVGPVRWKGPITVSDWEFARAHAPREPRPVVTGPYTLARLSEDRHYGDFDTFAGDVAAALQQEVAALAKAGATRIQIDEPALLASPSDEPRARRLFERVVAGAAGAEVWLALYLGSPAGLLDKIAAWPAAGVFLDAVTDPRTLDRLAQGAGVDGKSVGVGIVNARNTRLETVDEIRAALSRVADRLPAEKLAVTPSAGLEFLPRDRARAKLTRLTEGVRAFAGRG